LNGGTSAAAAVTIAGESVIGLLKVGRRQIYTLDQQSGQQKPTKALCVLDFFIADKYQRAGLGVRLFDYMLDCERVKPGHLAYDRPSFRLISFLSKHYRLDAPQHFYRFVVFPEFGNQHQQRPVCGNKPNYRKGLVLE
jgi:alpha-tubulin N-acetyltransferase 1